MSDEKRKKVVKIVTSCAEGEIDVAKIAEAAGCCDADVEISNCTSEASNCCCNVESLITVDDRGQMVLPKSLRDAAGICPGDKLAAVTLGVGGEVGSILLLKMGALNRMAKIIIQPMVKGVLEDS